MIPKTETDKLKVVLEKLVHAAFHLTDRDGDYALAVIQARSAHVKLGELLDDLEIYTLVKQ